MNPILEKREEIKVILLKNIRIPTPIRRIPVAISIFLRCLFIPSKKVKKELRKRADNIKGMPSPAE